MEETYTAYRKPLVPTREIYYFIPGKDDDLSWMVKYKWEWEKVEIKPSFIPEYAKQLIWPDGSISWIIFQEPEPKFFDGTIKKEN